MGTPIGQRAGSRENPCPVLWISECLLQIWTAEWNGLDVNPGLGIGEVEVPLTNSHCSSETVGSRIAEDPGESRQPPVHSRPLAALSLPAEQRKNMTAGAVRQESRTECLGAHLNCGLELLTFRSTRPRGHWLRRVGLLEPAAVHHERQPGSEDGLTLGQ